MHENSHIHITPCPPSPVVTQPLNYSISAPPVGPPGHLAIILSVISLTDEWPYYSHRGAVFRETVLSQQEHISRSCVSTHTHTAIYLPICVPQRKLSTCPYLVKTQGRPREDTHTVEQHVGQCIWHIQLLQSLGWPLYAAREAEEVVQANDMPIKSADKA